MPQPRTIDLSALESFMRDCRRSIETAFILAMEGDDHELVHHAISHARDEAKAMCDVFYQRKDAT